MARGSPARQAFELARFGAGGTVTPVEGAVTASSSPTGLKVGDVEPEMPAEGAEDEGVAAGPEAAGVPFVALPAQAAKVAARATATANARILPRTPPNLPHGIGTGKRALIERAASGEHQAAHIAS